MIFGLSEKTMEKFHSVFKKYSEVEQVLIYGSRAKGNYREGSDIDLTLVGNHISDKILSSIKVDIDELNTPYLVDVSVFHHLKSASLIEHIQSVGKEFYKRETG